MVLDYLETGRGFADYFFSWIGSIKGCFILICYLDGYGGDCDAPQPIRGLILLNEKIINEKNLKNRNKEEVDTFKLNL